MSFGLHDRTKIVATLGPASDTPATIRAMMRAGMDMVRLNFSHGTPKHHALLAARVRAAARALHVLIPIIGDLQGPRVRVAHLLTPRNVKRGEDVVLSSRAERLPAGKVGSDLARASLLRHSVPRKDSEVIPIDDPTLWKDLKRGDRIEIANGTIELHITLIRANEIQARVVRGGTITTGRGIVVMGRSLSLPAITKKDVADMKLGVKLGVDYLNVSFVKKPNDLVLARSMVRAAGGRGVKIMAKIETAEAVKNIKAILKVSDAIMIGRGDLAFAFPIERLPIIQKDLIRAAHNARKPVIVATEMLASMVTNRAPTRAEVSDVANAVLDHASATMLSEETAIGTHPVLAVRTMARIIHETEGSRYDRVTRLPAAGR